ncbi:MAG: metallophosphoesterase [Rhodocyclaceae bacterium]|nr:metallophosphoesterase [Rhodocyclaceae bacterium]
MNDSSHTADTAYPDEPGPGLQARAARRRGPGRGAVVFVAGLFALLHAYVGLRLLPAMDLAPAGNAAAIALLAASAAWIPASLLAPRYAGRWHRALAVPVVWGGLFMTGLASTLLVLTVLRDLLLLPALLLLSATTLQALAHDSAVAVAVLAPLASLIGLFNARRTPRVVEVDIPLPDLPPALEGFRIVQLSDIHVGPTIKRGFLARIVARVNQLDAHVVAITGDLVDGKVAELRGHVATLAGLGSRFGTYFVTGNHEYYSGADAWIAELRRLGINVLHNRHEVLRHHGAELVLAGVSDYSGHHYGEHHRSDPQAALRGAPSTAPRVLLAHQPRSAPAAAEAGFHLQISGHTHGGQFFPWNHFVRFQQPYTAGLHRLAGLWVYTSRGTGYWGPPKRLGAPSEITLIRLTAGRLG